MISTTSAIEQFRSAVAHASVDHPTMEEMHHTFQYEALCNFLTSEKFVLFIVVKCKLNG